MLVKRKYNIGDKVKIQTTNNNGIVYYDCEIIDCERKQIYVNGESENVYKLRTINNKHHSMQLSRHQVNAPKPSASFLNVRY